MYVRPAWETMYNDPEIAASWARFSTHKPRDDGLRPESNLKDLEGEANDMPLPGPPPGGQHFEAS